MRRHIPVDEAKWGRVRTEWICSTSDELAVGRRVGRNPTTFWYGTERGDSY